MPEASDPLHEELNRRSITDQMIGNYREAVNTAPEAKPEPRAMPFARFNSL